MWNKYSLNRYLYISVVVFSAAFYFLQAVSSQEHSKPDMPKPDKGDVRPSISASGRAFPRLSLLDGVDLGHPGEAASGTSPVKMISADFDSDGIADLVTAGSGTGIKFYRGNANSIYPNNSDESREKDGMGDSVAPFYPVSRTFFTSISPDFFDAGDFNADGHQDILAARVGDRELHLMAGDGAGNFSEGFQIQLAGSIASLATGEVGMRDGQSDAVVAIEGESGAMLAIFEHPEGAFKHAPELIRLPAAVDHLAIGNLDTDFFGDIAAASVDRITIVRGRGHAYPWDRLPEYDIQRPDPVVESRSLSFEVAAIATGYFTEKGGESLAFLTTTGTIETLDSPRAAGNRELQGLRSVKREKSSLPARASAKRLSRFGTYAERGRVTRNDDEWVKGDDGSVLPPLSPSKETELSKEQIDALVSGASDESPKSRESAKRGFLRAISPRATEPLAQWKLQTIARDAKLATAASSLSRSKLVKVRVSDSGRDELAFVDTSSNQIHLMIRENLKRSREASTSEIVSLDVATSPVALLPMRLNADALSDLVVLREGSSEPSVVMTAPAATFVVTTTDDEDDGSCGGTCSLREAIDAADGSPGADIIRFSIGSGPQTLRPETNLPQIDFAVTIDGGTQPGFSGQPVIEISGDLGEEGDNGLSINAANVVVRSLAINRFRLLEQEDGDIGGSGISIYNFSGESHTAFCIVEGNYLGTDRTGSQDRGNEQAGLFIFDSDNHIVGGSSALARNVISGNGNGEMVNGNRRAFGIGVTAGNGNLFIGNYVGVAANGNSRLSNSSGIFLSGANNQVGADTANSGNVVSGNTHSSPSQFDPQGCEGTGIFEGSVIDVTTGEWVTANNSFKGNRIGTNATGNVAVSNCRTGLFTSPRNTATVGSITASGRNTISGNTDGGLFCSTVGRGAGVFFTPEPANLGPVIPEGFCRITGNNVGTDVNGNFAIPNDHRRGDQTFIFNGALVVYNTNTFSTVGGNPGTSPNSCTGHCNLVSGNGTPAIYDIVSGIAVEGAIGDVGVWNNYVGTNKSGTAAVGNYIGIGGFRSGSHSIGGGFTQGGNDVSLGNLVSGNRQIGINVSTGSSPTLIITQIRGNLVGTDPSGLTAVPNNTDLNPFAGGVSAGGTGVVIIGGIQPVERNVISGNNGTGITYGTAVLTTATVNNYVGVNKNGDPLGNTLDGVHLRGSFDYLGDNGVGNVIAHNGRNGVYVSGSQGNRIRYNSIYNNGALGIDLTADTAPPVEPDGVTENDCQDSDNGPNKLQNYPLLSTPVFNGDGTVSVEGFYFGAPSTTLTLDLYSNSSADPSDFGEGQTFIGSTTFTTDDFLGYGTFFFTSAGQVTPGVKITGTASDINGDTSEFSCFAGQCTVIVPSLQEALAGGLTCPVDIIVNVTTDQPDNSPDNPICDVDEAPGIQCSLRGAIQTAEGAGQPGPTSIGFDIPGSGIQTITPASELPLITQPIQIDGATQPGYTNSPMIELRGDLVPATNAIRLGIGSSGSLINALAINQFFSAIAISSGNNKVERCYLGLHADGTIANTPGTQQAGVFMQTSTSTGNRIGGFAGAGNVISNNRTGVAIGVGATGNKVLGNRIGTNVAGTASIPNIFGVLLGSNGNAIGDIASADGNLISGNSTFGVALTTNASGNRIINNSIGTTADGTEVLPNGEVGIYLHAGATENNIEKNVIGGHDLTEGSSGIGFAVDAGPTNSITENFIGVGRDGTTAIANKYGIVNVSDGQIIGAQNGGNTIGHNGISGIWTLSFPGDGNPIVEDNVVEYNMIGTNGTDDIGNEELGIHISGEVQNTRVERNVISGNDAFGIAVTEGASANRLVFNIIGTNTSGTSAIANGGGIWIRQARNNFIESNLVSGNSLGILVGTNIGFGETLGFVEGFNKKLGLKNPGAAYKSGNRLFGNHVGRNAEPSVSIEQNTENNLGGAHTSGNQLSGNVVGLNAARDAALPASIGIAIGENARSNFIGSTSGAYNLVSGNTATIGYGIFLGTLAANPSEDALPQFNTFQGNIIGLGGNLQSTISNKKGFVLLQAARNTIGGDTAILANTIVASTEEGILVADGSRENTILKNFLGVLPPGFRSPRGTSPASPIGGTYGNSGNGIFISAGAANNVFGGVDPNTGPIIANNGGDGIAVSSTAGIGNRFRNMSIFGNAGLGIDIGDDGTSANDPADADTGPNNLQNYPQIDSKQIVNNELIIGFKVDSAPANSAYGANGIYVEFFKADLSSEGEKFLGFGYYTVADYNNGSPMTKTVNLGNIAILGITPGDRITATATDANGNTSEFTPSFAPTAAGVSISGRVMIPRWSPMELIQVTISGPGGETRSTIVGRRRKYTFDNLPAGRLYILTATSMSYSFTPRVVQAVDNVFDVDLFPSDE